MVGPKKQDLWPKPNMLKEKNVSLSKGIGVKNCQFYLVKRQLRGVGGGQKLLIVYGRSLSII